MLLLFYEKCVYALFSVEEELADEGSQTANSSDEEESQGTSSSFEEILAEQINQTDST